MNNTFCTRCASWVDTTHVCASTRRRPLSKLILARAPWLFLLLLQLAATWLTFRVWLRRKHWRSMRWAFMQDVSPWSTLSWGWAADIAQASRAGAVFDFTWLAASCDDEVRAYRCVVLEAEAMAAGDLARARHWAGRREQYVSHHDKVTKREMQTARARRSLASIGDAP